MVKTIAVPIDFRVDSLNALRLALNTIHTGKVNVVLIYAQTPLDSITDLLFYSPSEVISLLKSKEFEAAIAIIKNRYESLLNHISIELFQGFGMRSVHNFLEVHKIDKVFFFKNYTLQPPKKGFDPVPLLKKSGVSYQEVGTEMEDFSRETKALNTLFNDLVIEIANH